MRGKILKSVLFAMVLGGVTTQSYASDDWVNSQPCNLPGDRCKNVKCAEAESTHKNKKGTVTKPWETATSCIADKGASKEFAQAYYKKWCSSWMGSDKSTNYKCSEAKELQK